MKLFYRVITLFVLLVLSGCMLFPGPEPQPRRSDMWHAIHLLVYENKDLHNLAKEIPALADFGINTLILEVDYRFEFESHPELRQGDTPIDAETAGEFAELCRRYDMHLIPQFQCLGHQSWAEKTFPLLTVYPEFDLTPGAFPDNEGIYCREWDPMNPRVNEIVFSLIDELITAFKADAFHIGMDEVFLLGSTHSPSTRGMDPAEVFANVVNDFHNHLVQTRQIEMLMWGDRLIDGKKYGYGAWEGDTTGTHPAIDMIPTDIIICDWHYEKRESYPSIPLFLEKGFRVLPASWKKTDAVEALIQYSFETDHPAMLGHLFTTWKGGMKNLTAYPPLISGLDLLFRLQSKPGPQLLSVNQKIKVKTCVTK